jgi:hypothetical protein
LPSRDQMPRVKLTKSVVDAPLRANDGETSESRKFSLTWA